VHRGSPVPPGDLLGLGVDIFRGSAKNKLGSACEVVAGIGWKADSVKFPVGAIPGEGLRVVLGIAFFLGEERGLVDRIDNRSIIGGLEDVDTRSDLTGSDTVDILAEIRVHAGEVVDPLFAVEPLDFRHVCRVAAAVD